MNARLKLTITSPLQSFIELITVAEAKEFCDIPDADTTRDWLLTTYIAAARDVAELRQGRDLVSKHWDLTMDCIPAIIETRENLSSVELFRYRDSDGNYTTMVENTDYIVDTSAFILTPPYNGQWPSFTAWPSSAVLVRYTVTPPAPDAQVLMGMRFLINQWYVNRVPAEAAGSTIQQYPFCLGLLDHGRVERA
jgi:hypothetical protein